MKDLDLSNVDPLKWDETRRRFDALTSVAVLDEPTRQQKAAAAKKLGLSERQFNQMLARYGMSHDLNDLIPIGRTKFDPASRRANLIDPRTREIAFAVIREMDPRTPLSVLTEMVQRRCRAAKVEAPSRSGVWYYVRILGPRSEARTARNTVLATSAYLKLPVEYRGGLVRPGATFLLNAADGQILAASIDATGSKPQIDDAIWQNVSRRRRQTIIADRIHVERLAELNVDGRHTLVPRTNAMVRMYDLVGWSIGKIRLGFKAGTACPSIDLQADTDQPLSPADAALALEYACAAHNAKLKEDLSARQAVQ